MASDPPPCAYSIANSDIGNRYTDPSKMHILTIINWWCGSHIVTCIQFGSCKGRSPNHQIFHLIMILYETLLYIIYPLSLQLSKEKPPQSYIELKTNREILTDRNKSSFRRYKLMKWWAQSFLVGVPKITCGFRNDDGVVKVLQTFKTAEIPHETQVVLVCLYFSCTCLISIK